MGSIKDSQQILGTFTFLVDIPLEAYDPWVLPYGKAPEGVYAKTVKLDFPLRDCRTELFDNGYSIERSRDFLKQNGFTVARHHTALHHPPYGPLEHFRDAQLVGNIYYQELVQLMKDVTGCSQVFVTDSVLRMTDAEKAVSDASWQRTSTAKDGDQAEDSATVRIHKPSPSPPTRVPHWDFNALGARQTIRNWSGEMATCARRLGIIDLEDELCAPQSATREEVNSIIEERYNGPRYACFSVWRPLRTVTRDPLAMAPYRSVERDSNFVAVSHRIKQPGADGDWLRELPTLRVKSDTDINLNLESNAGLQWYYVSEQAIDEVLIIKSFDSAALRGSSGVTGEAAGVAHASPEIGTAGYGEPRESIEVRMVAFW